MYVNGFLDGISATDFNNTGIEINTTGPEGESAVVTIGSRPGPNETEFFRGLLDEMRIYNRALNQTEIQAIFIAEQPDEPTTLINDYMLYQ